VLLRLPHELKELFEAWLAAHEPRKAAHVMNRIRDMRGGKDYDSRFGVRMRGTGEYADLIAQAFRYCPPQAWVQRFPAAGCCAIPPTAHYATA